MTLKSDCLSSNPGFVTDQLCDLKKLCNLSEPVSSCVKREANNTLSKLPTPLQQKTLQTVKV